MSNKKPIVLSFPAGRAEIRAPKVMSDKSIQFVINVGEQDSEVMSHIYTLLKDGIETLVISNMNLEDIDNSELEE